MVKFRGGAYSADKESGLPIQPQSSTFHLKNKRLKVYCQERKCEQPSLVRGHTLGLASPLSGTGIGATLSNRGSSADERFNWTALVSLCQDHNLSILGISNDTLAASLWICSI